MEQLYRASPNTRPIFAAAGADPTAFYTAQVSVEPRCKWLLVPPAEAEGAAIIP